MASAIASAIPTAASIATHGIAMGTMAPTPHTVAVETPINVAAQQIAATPTSRPTTSTSFTTPASDLALEQHGQFTGMNGDIDINHGRAHLVIGDDAERVVVNIAMHGDNVDVAMRSPSQHMNDTLAQSRGQLDDSLRRAGLQTGTSTTGNSGNANGSNGQPQDSQRARASAPSTISSSNIGDDEPMTSVRQDPRLIATA